MKGRFGGIARPTLLGSLAAVLWLASHPNQNGRTDRETLDLIARHCREAIDREPL